MKEMNTYVPGVCNIGPAEIRRRRHAGWIGVVATAAVWTVLFFMHLPAFWRLLVFFPAALAASGFLQAFMHFCAGFGSRGLFNFGPEVGKTETVIQAEFRDKDRKKSLQITGLSAAIGAVVAILAFLF
ncbi:MAG TPA: hypothetical protein VKF42_08310 [Chitinivibrionales bacterium]|nr:hypothetical protein [Chitinivibrionales bacterium]